MASSSVIGLLRVLLSANTAEFQTAMRDSSAAAKTWSKDLKQIGQEASNIGSSMTKFLTVPLAGIGLAFTKLAMDFESSFAGVKKTVNASETELAGMAMAFRQLSKEIPVNVNELNRLGEAAGALGIPKAEIVDFAKVMAQLGVTTNLTSDAAAEGIAKIQNIFQSAGKDTDRFASSLVALGNDGASTESQILELSTRIASAGNAVGLTQDKVLGFASAIANVGIEAEAGGSAISRVFIDIGKAVSEGGEALGDFARVAGKDVKEFARLFKEDAAGATTAFIEGLGRVKESGGDLIGTLEQLGFTELRQANVLRSLALSGDNLSKSLATANQGWRENTALTTEAAKRFETTESQLTLLWNRLKDVGITFGNSLLPLIKSTVGAFDALIPALEGIGNAFAALPGPVQMLVVGIAAAVAAAGPLLYVFGQLALSASALTAAFTTKGIATRALTLAMGTLGTTAATTAGATGILGAAFALLTNPVTLAIAALGLIGVAIYKVSTAETELERSVRSNAAAFKTHSDALDSALSTYQRLKAEQRLTTDQTAQLDAATRLLAAASGLSVEAFNREQAASGQLTAELGKQLAERKKLYDETAKQARASAVDATRQLAQAQEALRRVQSGQTQKVDFVGDVPTERAFTGAERAKEVERLTAVIGELSKKAGEAQTAYSKLADSVGNDMQTFEQWGANAKKATTGATEATRTYAAQLAEAQKALDAFATKDPAKFKDLSLAIQSDKFELDELRKTSGLSELAFKVLTDRIKDTGRELQKTTGWIDDFRAGAKKLETQLQMAAKAGVPMTVVLEEFGSQIEKVANRAPILGDAIGDATKKAADALEKAEFGKILEKANKELNADARKLIADMEKTGREAGDKFWSALQDSNKKFIADATNVQRGYIELAEDSLDKRKALINLEFDAQVQSLDKTSSLYAQNLALIEARRRRALAEAVVDWQTHAQHIGSVLAQAFEGVASITTGIVALLVGGAGRVAEAWVQAAKAVAKVKALGPSATAADRAAAAAGAVNVGAAGAAIFGGAVAGGDGSQVAGMASGLGGLALAGTSWGAAASTAALAAATAGIGLAAVAIMVGIKKILHNNAEWNKLAKGIGRDLGVNISEALAKQMEADSKKFGRGTAVLLHLNEIIDEAGGVQAFGLDKAIAKTRDLFSELERGKLTAKQVGDTFNTLFAKILPEAISKTTGRASASFRELMAVARAHGVESAELTQFITGQATSAASGIQQFLQNATLTTQAGAEAAGGVIAGAFGALRDADMSTRDALAQLQPAIAALQEQFVKTGFSGGAAFDEIARLAGIATDKIAGPALDAINGLSNALVGAENAGFLTQEMFTGLTGEIMANRQAIIDQGTSAEDVNTLMQKDLQRIWEQQQDNNFAVDEQTQLLLDQAEAQGKVGDKFRGFQDKVVRALDSIANSFRILTGEADKFGNTLNGLPKNVNVDVNVREKHTTEREDDGGGYYTGPGGPYDPGIYDPPPQFERGSNGFRNFGRGTLAMLHGVEAVVRPGDLSQGSRLPVILNVDGREFARAMVPVFPGEASRLGVRVRA